MKIKNVSVMVIGILGHDLMPDELMECNEFIVKNPAVETLVKMGFLEVDDSEEKAKAIKEAAMREAREQIMKEQKEAAARAAAEAKKADAKAAAEAKKADAKAAAEAKEADAEAAEPDDKEVDNSASEPEAPAAHRRTRRVTKPSEPDAE